MEPDSDWVSFRQAAWRIAPCEGGIEGAKVQLYHRLGWVMSRRIDYPTDENGRPLDFARPPLAFDDPMPRQFLEPPPYHPRLAGKDPASPDWFGLWGQLLEPAINDSDWRDFNWQLDRWLYDTDNLLVSWKYVQRAIVDRNAALSDGELENAAAKVAWSFPEALGWIATGDFAEVAIIARHMASVGRMTRKAPELFAKHIVEGVGRLAFITSERRCNCGATPQAGVPRWKNCKCLSNAWTKLANIYTGNATRRLPQELPRLETDLTNGVFKLIWPDGADAISFAVADMSAGVQPQQSRAPSVKTGRPPNDPKILAKADEMKARGLDGRTIAKQMRLEPEFENVATTAVRELIKGRWKAGRPKKAA